MRHLISLLLACGFALSLLGAAIANPEGPGAPQKAPIALRGGVIHPVSGPAIEGGILLFDEGKIVALGNEVEIPENTERVELEARLTRVPRTTSTGTGTGAAEGGEEGGGDVRVEGYRDSPY